MRTFALVSALIWWCITTTENVYALQETPSPENRSSPVSALGSDYHNSIKLLQNRFRVDHNVEEVTLVFFREYGSAPVVLVRPDGSKIFHSQAENDDPENAKVLWFDDATYDMVKIRNPVAGPWQAVGQILPGSRVMVVSDVQLHAEPLPDVLFAGEILKQTASLTNNGEPIEYKEFRDAVELTIDFASTNNPNYDNFNETSERVATFQDNGMGMDEVPLDGVFTGQFNLNIPAGEWKPVFQIATPMYSREQVSSPLVVHASPVIQTVEFDDGEKGYHTLFVDVDQELVKLESLLVDGKVSFPNGDVQNFSLTQPSDKARQHRIIAFEDGLFKVKLTAYGKTVTDRDFILDVPEYSFVAEPPQPPPPAEETVSETPKGSETVAAEERPVVTAPPITPPEQPKEEMDNSTLFKLLLVVNGTILLIGAIVIGALIWWRKRVARGMKPVSSETRVKPPENKTENNGWHKKISRFFSKSKKAQPAKEKSDGE